MQGSNQDASLFTGLYGLIVVINNFNKIEALSHSALKMQRFEKD